MSFIIIVQTIIIFVLIISFISYAVNNKRWREEMEFEYDELLQDYNDTCSLRELELVINAMIYENKLKQKEEKVTGLRKALKGSEKARKDMCRRLKTLGVEANGF